MSAPIVPTGYESYQCPNCGYDLRGLYRPVCPECGRSWSLEQVEASWDRPGIYSRASRWLANFLHRHPALAKLAMLIAITTFAYVAAKLGLVHPNPAY